MTKFLETMSLFGDFWKKRKYYSETKSNIGESDHSLYVLKFRNDYIYFLCFLVVAMCHIY